ncbi:MAG: hypothetical protein LPK28_03240, partial [Bacteroidota bacterium]|nr:hypothetical protein [Bacteroidota bacterium]
MDRRSFIKKTALGAAGSLVAPYILPSGRLFAATGARKANHVVFCLFSGGVRNLESVLKADGNLMPNMLSGNEAISTDIQSSLSPLPPNPLSTPLQDEATLFKGFKYSLGPTGHFNGHITAITGQSTGTDLSLREHPEFPTVFELYRKHSDPKRSAMNAWWVSHSNNLYPILNYSRYPGYGPDFGANQISPRTLFAYDTANEFSNSMTLSPDHQGVADDLRGFFNGNFNPSGVEAASVWNTPEEADQIQAFIKQMMTEYRSGLHNNPWGIQGGMSGDMRNIFYAEKILQEFEPELLVVNLFDVDVAHSNFTKYCQALRNADWAVGHLWNTIQNTPGLANDTILIIAPEIGRNGTPNSIIDQNG